MDNIKKYSLEIEKSAPELYRILKETDCIDDARDWIIDYLHHLSRELYQTGEQGRSLEWYLKVSCMDRLREIFSLRSEKLAGTSPLSNLYYLVNEEWGKIVPNIAPAFFEDILHIFYGMMGESRRYANDKAPAYMKMKGREAALARSAALDSLAGYSMSFIKRYKTGLYDDVKMVRRQNKERILSVLKATEDDWKDYTWHLKHIIRDRAQLSTLVTLNESEKRAIEAAKQAKLPFGITPYYVSLMDDGLDRSQDHAVRGQVIPPEDYVERVTERKEEDIGDCLDFMREHDTSPIDLVTRRYPQIAILKPYNTCAQICVYCQRNWEIDDVLIPQALASPERLDQAIAWLAEHPAINEILITGGDPLVMDDKRVDEILGKVTAIKHVERIRIGSRTPVVLPQRFTSNLIDILKKYHKPGVREIALVTHFEHTYEVTPESLAAVQKVKQLGIGIYNQAVFTMENSRRFELCALRRVLRLIGVDSYYTFNTKGKEETRHYQVPMARLQQEAKEEARLMPGLVRTDEPVYNVPRLGKNYLRAEQHHSLISINPEGGRVYEFHPWEKNLARAETYIDIDVPIHDYLENLKQKGENIEDYSTIWYYF